ncbi:MAG: Fpg/Nei family DNA glycosylase [Chloroflexota bacterium]
MPEGDTLWRTAATLRPAVLGQTITAFRSSVRKVSDTAETLGVIGSCIDTIETRGKHLLIQFSGGATLRTHLQMTGSWHVYRPGSPWQKPSRLAVVVIETPRAVAVCFSAPTVELLATANPAALDAVRHLGPDVLAPDFDLDQALGRLRARADDEIAVALLDQSALAGIGNVYKSEVLFLCGVSPFTRVRAIGDVTLRRIVETAVRLMRRNLTTEQRTTTTADAPQRHWVYGCTGRLCQRCGTCILRRLQGLQARATYWCPHCQPSSDVRI